MISSISYKTIIYTSTLVFMLDNKGQDVRTHQASHYLNTPTYYPGLGNRILYRPIYCNIQYIAP